MGIKLEDLRLVKGLEKLFEDFPCESASYDHRTREMTCLFLPDQPERCKPCIRMCGHKHMFSMRQLIKWLRGQQT